MRALLLLQILLVVTSGNSSSPDASVCPLTAAHSVVYSRATGVGGASVIWIQDLLVGRSERERERRGTERR
jgi:hypothetical protein